MEESPESARRARGLERFLLFSDGVTAIAVTLLVLPLVDAVTDTDGEGLSVWDILNGMRWEMFSFALSFAVIVLLWLAHQDVFESVVGFDRPILWAGIVWLFGIVTLAFSTALIADHSGERLTVIIYIINLGVAMGALTFATNYFARHPEFLHAGVTVDGDDLLESWVQLGLLVAALLLVLVFPVLGFAVMVLLFLDGPVISMIRRWWPA